MRAVRGDCSFEDQGAYQNLKRWYSVRLMNRAIDKDQGLEFFSRFLPPAQEVDVSHADPVKSPNNNIDRVNVFGDTDAISQIAWGDIIATADRHNVPGEFTALIGWEWSSIPTGANLHRVVITPDGADKAANFTLGSNDSQYADLWQWLEILSTTGTRFIHTA